MSYRASYKCQNSDLLVYLVVVSHIWVLPYKLFLDLDWKQKQHKFRHLIHFLSTCMFEFLAIQTTQSLLQSLHFTFKALIKNKPVNPIKSISIFILCSYCVEWWFYFVDRISCSWVNKLLYDLVTLCLCSLLKLFKKTQSKQQDTDILSCKIHQLLLVFSLFISVLAFCYINGLICFLYLSISFYRYIGPYSI